jgi:sporulation protein YlmC with PRC-barrel domain
MAGITQFTIGSEARCTDGVCGEVIRVVVDPIARAVTHLIVEPRHRVGRGRLVPLDVVDATMGEVRLRCTLKAFEKLPFAEEAQFLPGPDDYVGYQPSQTLSWPYYGLGGAMGNSPPPIIYDKVPLGEVTVGRGEQVHASDGDIGRVQGLVIDPDDYRVTHVLLQEGHLWGRKQVAIPISAVSGVIDGISLSMTKKEVQKLPPVDLHQSNG